MRLLIATITFAVTMGMLFLFDTRKTTDTAEKNYAQILEALDATESPIAKHKLTAKKTATPKISTTAPTAIARATALAPSTIPTVSSTLSPTTIPQTTATITASTTPATTLPPISSPTTTSTPQESSYQITVVSITSPAKQNSIARLDIKTAPEAQCGVKVTLPSGSQSTAKGLEPKTADSASAITWSWRINWNTKPGTATIEINCTKDGQNFSKVIQVEIAE